MLWATEDQSETSIGRRRRQLSSRSELRDESGPVRLSLSSPWRRKVVAAADGPGAPLLCSSLCCVSCVTTGSDQPLNIGQLDQTRAATVTNYRDTASRENNIQWFIIVRVWRQWSCSRSWWSPTPSDSVSGWRWRWRWARWRWWQTVSDSPRASRSKWRKVRRSLYVLLQIVLKQDTRWRFFILKYKHIFLNCKKDLQISF